MREAVYEAAEAICRVYRSGGKVLVCGNGGSAADAEHIVGELMKGFRYKRPIHDPALEAALTERFGEEGALMLKSLQGALPAISLVSQSALISAFGNDVDGSLAYAQQVYGYGRRGDMLIAISTSGNSANVVAAARMAAAMGLSTVGFTGSDGGLLRGIVDILLAAPEQETYLVQQYHMGLYHALCLAVECEMFDQAKE